VSKENKDLNYLKVEPWKLDIYNNLKRELASVEAKHKKASGKSRDYLEERVTELKTAVEMEEESIKFKHPPQTIYRAREQGWIINPCLMGTRNAWDKKITASGALTILGYLTVDPENDGSGALSWEMQKAYGQGIYFVNKALGYLTENKEPISRMRELMGYSKIRRNEPIGERAPVEKKKFSVFYSEALKSRNRDAFDLMVDTLRYYGEVSMVNPDVHVNDPADLPPLEGATLVYNLMPPEEFGGDSMIVMSVPFKGEVALDKHTNKRGSHARQVDMEEAREFLELAGRKKIAQLKQRRENIQKGMWLDKVK
jgi:hypothetical protein